MSPQSNNIESRLWDLLRVYFYFAFTYKNYLLLIKYVHFNVSIYYILYTYLSSFIYDDLYYYTLVFCYFNICAGIIVIISFNVCI